MGLKDFIKRVSRREPTKKELEMRAFIEKKRAQEPAGPSPLRNTIERLKNSVSRENPSPLREKLRKKEPRKGPLVGAWETRKNTGISPYKIVKQNQPPKPDITSIGVEEKVAPEPAGPKIPITKNNLMNFFVKNVDPVNSYTYRFFGANTGLPSVDNNNYLVTYSNLQANTSPGFSVISPVNNYLYVADQGAAKISVIDTNTNTWVKDINVGNFPFAPGVANGYVYVANFNSNTVSVIDAATNLVVTTIPVGVNPTFICVNFDETKIYVCGQFNQLVSVIDTNTNTVIATISVGTNLRYSVALPNGNVYIGSFNDNKVAVIDGTTDTLTTTITVGNNPYYVFYINGFVYSVDQLSNQLSIINPNTNTVVGTISLPGSIQPYWLTYDPNSSFMYVTDIVLNKIYVINYLTNTLVTTISSTGTTTIFAVYSTVHDLVFVTNNGTGTIDVIDPSSNTIVNTVPAGAGTTFAIQAPNGYLYFSNNGTNTVTSLSYEIPVTIVVNGGTTSLPQANQEMSRDPAKINNICIDCSSRDGLDNALVKYERTGAGYVESVRVNLLQKYTADNSDTVNVVCLAEKDFPDPVLDGSNYIQHVIKPSSTVYWTVRFDQVNISETLEEGVTPGRLIYSDHKPIKKKYLTAEFRVVKEEK